jgi:hypothetical protein
MSELAVEERERERERERTDTAIIMFHIWNKRKVCFNAIIKCNFNVFVNIFLQLFITLLIVLQSRYELKFYKNFIR